MKALVGWNTLYQVPELINIIGFFTRIKNDIDKLTYIRLKLSSMGPKLSYMGLNLTYMGPKLTYMGLLKLSSMGPTGCSAEIFTFTLCYLVNQKLV